MAFFIWLSCLVTTFVTRRVYNDALPKHARKIMKIMERVCYDVAIVYIAIFMINIILGMMGFNYTLFKFSSV